MGTQQSRYQELDALRGIAALMVVFFHFTMGRPEAAYGFKLGITGVDLFFIISGFVITMSITRVRRGIDFVINRTSRLYPAYWAAVSITFLLVAGRSLSERGNLSAANIVHYLANLTMFQFYFMIPDLDGPYWSLLVEMLFYLSILLLFQYNQFRRVNEIGVGLILVTVLAQLFFWNYKMKVFLHATVLLKYLPLFLAGINFFKIHNEQQKLFPRYTVIAFCFISQVLLFHNCARARVFISPTEYTVALVIIFGLFTLFVNRKLNFLVNKLTLFFGRISYPLYLNHQFLSLSILFPFLIKNHHWNFWVAAFCITLPIDILLAFVITRFVDEPYSKKLKRYLQSIPVARVEHSRSETAVDAETKSVKPPSVKVVLKTPPKVDLQSK